MPVELPGFVDNHVHILEAASGSLREQVQDPAEHHRELAARGSNPMDEPATDLAPPDLVDRVTRVLDDAATRGLTSVTETGLNRESTWHALLELRARGSLPIAVKLFFASGLADQHLPSPTGDNQLTIEGVKFYADGWLGSRTCAVNTPFADRPDDRGVLFVDALTLARRGERFAAMGMNIATHAIGDRAVDEVIAAYEMIYGSDCAKFAPRIEHASLVTDSGLDKLSELGIVVCMQPRFHQSDISFLDAALGTRCHLAYRWEDMVSAGVQIISGSDSPIETLNPLANLQALVSFPDSSTAPFTIDEALALLTDASTGSVYLDADPRHVRPEEIPRINVLRTSPRS